VGILRASYRRDSNLPCTLIARNFKDGVILAVNHDGDSDSTGSITGNLLGTAIGEFSFKAVTSTHTPRSLWSTGFQLCAHGNPVVMNVLPCFNLQSSQNAYRSREVRSCFVPQVKRSLKTLRYCTQL
jgi:hypothetical protein